MENILNFRGVCPLQKVKRCDVPDLPQAQLNQRLGSACDNRSVVTLIFNEVDFILFIQFKKWFNNAINPISNMTNTTVFLIIYWILILGNNRWLADFPNLHSNLQWIIML